MRRVCDKCVRNVYDGISGMLIRDAKVLFCADEAVNWLKP